MVLLLGLLRVLGVMLEGVLELLLVLVRLLRVMESELVLDVVIMFVSESIRVLGLLAEASKLLLREDGNSASSEKKSELDGEDIKSEGGIEKYVGAPASTAWMLKQLSTTSLRMSVSLWRAMISLNRSLIS